MTRQISETDLNILAQRFYETKGPQVVLRTMTAKEDIVSGLRGVFETLGYEVVDGDRVLLDILIPDMRVVPRETRTTFVGRHAITVKVEQILRNRTYDRHPDDEDLFNEMLDEVDEAIRSEVFHG